MQIIANGLFAGSNIAILALAFQLVYLSTKVFHVAMGAVYTLVPIVAWQCYEFGAPWYVATAAGLAAGVIFSALIDVLNHAL